MALRITYEKECERAAASLTLTGYVRALVRDGDVPFRYRDSLMRLLDDVSRAHGTLDLQKMESAR